MLSLLALVALALAGCGSSSAKAKASAKPAGNTTTPPTSSVTGIVVGANEVKVIPGTATGNSPCEKAAPTPASPGQVAGGGGGTSATKTAADVAASEHGERGAVEQLPLSPVQRATLDAQMTLAKAVAKKFPTVKDALAGGYMESTPFVPCIGAHYTNVGLAGSFDPSKPSELLYDGTEPTSKIVGLSYLVYQPGGSPPPGFAGDNDHWHQHNANGGLCLKGGFVVGGEDMSRADCAKRGGTKTLLTDIWMLHAWIVPGWNCAWGVFSGECPALGGVLCGNAFEAPKPNGSDCPGGALG